MPKNFYYEKEDRLALEKAIETWKKWQEEKKKGKELAPCDEK